uniref:Uncharacterized protein n=1 Tax=Panagrolaimus sp. ES5 TaxID=591445 RepID=A0AC34GFX7_9BILA
TIQMSLSLSTRKFPSVTSILGATEDYTSLYIWQCEQIQKHGSIGFKIISEKNKKSGTNFHKAVELLLKGLKDYGKISDHLFKKVLMEVMTKDDEMYLIGILPFLKTIPKTEWMEVEKNCTNYYFSYTGKFDAIVELECV